MTATTKTGKKVTTLEAQRAAWLAVFDALDVLEGAVNAADGVLPEASLNFIRETLQLAHEEILNARPRRR